MVFSRIFGKSQAPAPPAEEAPPEETEAPADAESAADESYDETGEEHPDWATRASRVIVGGASTGSKRPDKIYGGRIDDAALPTHYVSATGCRVVTTEGDTLVDCTMALGSVALGYAEPQLTRAVIEALAHGSVSGLPPAVEVEVAEAFCGVVPCAERVQFVKTGADAMSAAVRIARTYTGKDVVVGCGYFGWHDWSSDAAGVPASTQTNFRRIPFDDLYALEKAVSEVGDALAAIAIEPVIEREPSKEWIERARKLCDEKHAVLIFDEIKTGFRVATGGYQQYVGITPDLAAFGKAMANGYPLAAVCGHQDLMEVTDRTWISSTLASETASLTAASAVIAWHLRADICASLWSIGKDMREIIGKAISASGVTGVSVDGIDPMWLMRFDDPDRETAFLKAATRNGVLFKRGAYNFAAMAHDEEALSIVEQAASDAFVELREHGVQ